MLVLGWVLGDVLESTEDWLRYWRSDGDMVTLGMVSVLVGGVGQTVGLAIISLVGYAATDNFTSVVFVEYFQFTSLFGLGAIASLETVVEVTVVFNGSVLGYDGHDVVVDWWSGNYHVEQGNEGNDEFHFGCWFCLVGYTRRTVLNLADQLDFILSKIEWNYDVTICVCKYVCNCVI